jgi:hypothetical protein
VQSNATKSAASLSFHHSLQAQNTASPKWLPTTYDLRAWSFEDGCLCSILHGLLQLQIWTAFLLPARLFPTVARQSATQLSHTTFSQVSKSTQGSSSTCTPLLPFPARFSALHCSPHLRKQAVVAITPQTPPSLLLCGCSQLVRLGHRYACPGRQTCHYLDD